jgi:signal transduction histidine kinase
MADSEKWPLTPEQTVNAIVAELRRPIRTVMEDAEAAARTVEGAMVDLTRAITLFRRCQRRVERQVDSLRWLPALLLEDEPALPKPVPRRLATAVSAVARSAPRVIVDLRRDLRVLAACGVLDCVLETLISACRHRAPEATITIHACPVDSTQPACPVHSPLSIMGHAILITISDDGPGIPRKIRPHLFQPLARATRMPPPLGTGLWLSRRLVRAHGGDLWLDERAPGATFLSIWPAAS